MTPFEPVRVVPDGLLIAGEAIPIYSGSVHYWRHKREDWPRLLESVRRMGFRFLDTYFPWNVHELSPGQFDFGQITPEKDIAAFLKLCQEYGLYVLCRPGPHINAELPWFGYPERVANNPDVAMRTVSGAPAILPVLNLPIAGISYASEVFYREVEGYFDAVAPILKEFLYPNGGPIVAIQSDNETSFFFRMRCYDVDYHPDSIRLYRDWLRQRYGSINALNAAYGTDCADFDAVEPPRAYRARTRADLPYYLDWAEYQEYYISYGIIRIRQMLEARGLTGVPYYQNYPTFYPEVPFNMAGLEKDLDIVGVDAYPTPQNYPNVKRGSQFTSTMSRYPFIPEFGAGVWGWFRAQTPEEHRFNTRATFMHGIRGINLYMIADRDRWLNTPLREDGSPREEMFDIYYTLNSQLQALDWKKLRPERPALILAPRLYDRLRYLAVDAILPFEWLMTQYVPMPPDLFMSDSTPGAHDAIQQQVQVWINALRAALEASGIPYALGDDEISTDELAKYSLVVAPTFEWMDRALFDKIDSYVQAGGALICGPRVPIQTVGGEVLPSWGVAEPVDNGQRVDLDDDLWLDDAELWPVSTLTPGQQSFTRSFERGSGKVSLISGLFPVAALLRDGARSYRKLAPYLQPMLADAGLTPLYTCTDPGLDVTVLSGGGRRVVCVANPTAQAVTAELCVQRAGRWHDLDSGAMKQGEALALNIDPWTIRMWEVQP